MSVRIDIAVSRAQQADPSGLLAAAQRGDADAQAELFHRHSVRVARQILRMTGDANSVDDLLQEVFIAAFAALPGFRRDAQLETWLYTIAANKVRNWWDARRRREARETHAAAIAPRRRAHARGRARVVAAPRRVLSCARRAARQAARGLHRASDRAPQPAGGLGDPRRTDFDGLVPHAPRRGVALCRARARPHRGAQPTYRRRSRRREERT